MSEDKKTQPAKEGQEPDEINGTVHCGNCGMNYKNCTCNDWNPVYGQEVLKGDEYPGKAYQRLFNAINDASKLPLVSEMQDIIEIVHEDFPAEVLPTEGKDKEIVLCAAIWYKDTQTAKILPKNITEGTVVCGHRHGHCIHTLVALAGKRSVEPEIGQHVQGFITNKDRFVNRKEAGDIAFSARQIKEKTDCLFSEDLY